MKNKIFNLVLPVFLSLLLCLSTAVYADDETIESMDSESYDFGNGVEKIEGTSDNDIYGLDDSKQWETNGEETVKSNVFDDIKDSGYSHKAEFLVKIGIMDVADGKFRPNESYTRYELAKSIAAIVNLSDGYISDVVFNDVSKDDDRYPVLAFAFSGGYLSRYNDYTIRPDKPLSTKELVSAFVYLLGYGENAEDLNETGKDGVFETARRNKILDAVSYGAAEIKRGTVISFLYNVLTVPVNNIVGIWQDNGGSFIKIEHEKNDDKTLLTEYHDIYKSEGRLNACITSGIGDIGAVEKNEIKMDGKLYACSDASFMDCFGYNTEFFYRKNSSTKVNGEIVFILKGTDVREITVTKDDIISYKGNVLTYYSGNKKKTANVSKSFDLIRNGRAVKDINAADILPVRGTVTLVSNRGSGTYDTMIVWEYYNAVAKGISASDGNLKIQFRNSVLPLDYEAEKVVIDMFSGNVRMSVNISTSYYYDGDGVRQVKVTLPNVPANSLLSIFADRTELRNGKISPLDDALYIRVVVNQNVFDGTVSGISSSPGSEYGKLTVDNGKESTEYEISDDNYFDKTDNAVFVGMKAKFYTDFLGKIASYDVAADSDKLQYGYLIDAAVDGSLKTKLVLKVLTVKSKVVTFDASSTVKINGTSVSKAEAAKLKLSESAKILNPDYTISQPFKYKVNSKDEIYEIETATASVGVADGYDSRQFNREFTKRNLIFLPGWGNVFVETEQTDYIDNKTGETKHMNIDQVHYLGVPEAFFSVPIAETLDNDDLFTATNKWPASEGTRLNTELFDVDEFGNPGLAVCYTSVSKGYLGTPVIVVDDICYKTDENGDTHRYVCGFAGAGGYTEYPADRPEYLDKVKLGDIIIAIGVNGVLYDAEIIGNVVDIAKSDISSPPLMIRSANEMPNSTGFFLITQYEPFSYEGSTKTIVLQKGPLDESKNDGSREYKRISWWVNEWRSFGGATAVEVDVDTGRISTKQGTQADIKTVSEYSTAGASKMVMFESYGYGMRFVIIINKA